MEIYFFEKSLRRREIKQDFLQTINTFKTDN